MTGDPRVARVAALFQALAPADLDRLGEFYAADARFKDPFNDVRGLDAVRGVFAHMFRALESPRFAVRDRVEQGDRAFLTWDFSFRLRGAPATHVVHGGSLITFDAHGRIAEHVDYWDSADLFETLPLVGAAMRWLKRRASR